MEDRTLNLTGLALFIQSATLLEPLQKITDVSVEDDVGPLRIQPDVLSADRYLLASWLVVIGSIFYFVPRSQHARLLLEEVLRRVRALT